MAIKIYMSNGETFQYGSTELLGEWCPIMDFKFVRKIRRYGKTYEFSPRIQFINDEGYVVADSGFSYTSREKYSDFEIAKGYWISSIFVSVTKLGHLCQWGVILT